MQESHTSFDAPLRAPKIDAKRHQYQLLRGLEISMQSCKHIGIIKGEKSSI